MLLYDVPNLRPGFVRVDVFTTFRNEDGSAIARPILSSLADRVRAAPIDWGLGRLPRDRRGLRPSCADQRFGRGTARGASTRSSGAGGDAAGRRAR